MALLQDLRFFLVRIMSNAVRPIVRVVDLRKVKVPGQVELRPRRSIRWRLDRFTFQGAPPFWTRYGEVAMDAAFVLELRDAEVVGKGLLLDGEGRLMLESTIFQEEYLRRSYQNHWLFLRRWWPSTRHAHALPLINYLDWNYFHWMMESLGRLELVADRLGDPTLCLLVDSGLPGFVRTTIEGLYEVPSDRIVADGARRRVIDRCLLVSFPHTRNTATGMANVYDPELIRAVNRRGLARFGTATGPPVDLYITRRFAEERRILNEELLLQRFPHLQVVVLEDLAFADQVALFARARVVVGAHGAGLTNLLFARAPLVVEIFPHRRDEKDSSYFFQITDALGIRHHLLLCEPLNEVQDMRVDDALLDALGAMLEQAPA
jgi:hypothetical protein